MDVNIQQMVRWVKKGKKGDPAAFRALFDHFSSPVFRFAAHFIRDREAAKDVTQEVFIIAFQKISDLRKPSAFRSWLFRIASTVCRRHVRQRRRAAERPLHFEVIRFEPAEVAEPILREFKLDALEQAIQSVENHQHRKVVEMFYGSDNLTAREIGEQLNLPISTVTSTLCRVRHQLRRKALVFLEEHLQSVELEGIS